MYSNNRFPSHSISLQGLRVLVVDNHVDSCDLIALLLQPYGVEVKTASLTRQVLKLLVQWRPDVLVSEIALPAVDGFALVQSVRTLTGKWGKEVPVIAVTAYVAEEMRQRALSSGFDQWLTKPLDLDEFVAVLVHSVLSQSPDRAIGSLTGQVFQPLLQPALNSSHVLYEAT
ncbi:response regulator [Egbenema bharatensis]|uniref:response regulator n=1 Tax=Egbenema bharatensis TaxID=3463334 RepID=UPI003A8C193E